MTLSSVLQTCHMWRACALQPDLTLWQRCSAEAFHALQRQDCTARTSILSPVLARLSLSSRQATRRWNCESIATLLRLKRVRHLDLDGLEVSSRTAAKQLAHWLPVGLQSL
eukprot:CAMPEP_0119330676 /NCGR_PEP_ID=MMETSP1333-20130426/78752_1 /TAXON_ID=418940 /ORGANISM="Scyphosphaera apsteinii, Strain RCC1455" /LENGTH=110 /DNA_ID=CAMNT_0007340097 /DNA_START=37 /DNA_END=365 /DNA_ORIENTATION=+